LFTGYAKPYERQQLRGYRDISVEEEGNPKIWVDLRMGTPKKETMVRCNAHTPQEVIEAVATDKWEMEVRTQQPLLETPASQTMIWFKMFVPPPTEEEKEAAEILDVQFSDDEADVEEMEPSKALRIRKSMLLPVIKRVNSLNDLMYAHPGWIRCL
jgi:hypothetical protein